MKEKSYTMSQQVKSQKSELAKTTVWSREKISLLIELYKKHECLWNHWHEAYRSKDKRKRAIEEICQTLNIESFEFGKKIHNLRNQFNTEMKKLEQRIEEAGVSIEEQKDTEFRCKWIHFESLMFLRKVIEPRPGGYQSTYQPSKKVPLKFDTTSSTDEVNDERNNAEDLSAQFQNEDHLNEEVVTDDFQSFENEILEIEQPNSSEEICDQKYQPPSQTQEISTIMSAQNKPKKPQQTSSHTAYSSALDINVSEDTSVAEYTPTKANDISAHHSHLLTASTGGVVTTTPIISSIATSNSSNRPASVLRDQWDAFGELVANEFRNLNSDISRKRLKRKIMQSMLEVGEEDDQLTSKRNRTH